MWYQLSPFPSSNAAIAMQHNPGNIHQSVATPRYSASPWYVLIQLPNVIDTISKRWRSKRAFNTSPSHIFPGFLKQILTPSRFKLILLINNGIDCKYYNSCSFWAANFGFHLNDCIEYFSAPCWPPCPSRLLPKFAAQKEHEL